MSRLIVPNPASSVVNDAIVAGITAALLLATAALAFGPFVHLALLAS